MIAMTTMSIMIIGISSFVAAASPKTLAFLLRSSQASSASCCRCKDLVDQF